MSLQLLLDEMVEHEVMHRLENFGHDVEHVDFHDKLSKGDADRTLAEYSLDAERAIVTYDPDWVEDLPEDEFYCVLLIENEWLSAGEVAQIVHNMSRHYPESEFRGLQKTGQGWLDL
jgi:predicted nuclease of predicted toxin-antitoxin system